MPMAFIAGHVVAADAADVAGLRLEVWADGRTRLAPLGVADTLAQGDFRLAIDPAAVRRLFGRKPARLAFRVLKGALVLPLRGPAILPFAEAVARAVALLD